MEILLQPRWMIQAMAKTADGLVCIHVLDGLGRIDLAGDSTATTAYGHNP